MVGGRTGGFSDTNLINVSGTLYFSYYSELWKSDGTPEGTKLLASFDSASGPGISYIANVNGAMYFVANDGLTGFELWRSDGTTAGTVMVKDINPGAASSNPGHLVNVGGTLYFHADDGVHGLELWRSDGRQTQRI